MTVSLTGAATFALSAAGVLTKGQYDTFATRKILAGYSGTEAVDVSAATLDGSEPNASSFTKTWWFELRLLSAPPDTLRVKVFGGAGSVAVRVYSATAVDVAGGVEPTFAGLTSVASGTDVTWTTDADAQSYYVQVGLLSGAGTGWSLFWTDADPLEGGTWASAVDLDGDLFGSDQVDLYNAILEASEPTPTGITPIRTGWFKWTCPTPSPGVMTLVLDNSEASGSFSLAAYTGTSVGALTEVAHHVVAAGLQATIQFTPTAGTLYTIQAGSTLDDGTMELGWSGPANTLTPETVFKYLRCEVWDRLGATKVTELPRRKGAKFQSVLNGVGTGAVSVHKSDELLDPSLAAPYGAALLATGNIVKMWLGAKCVNGFVIRQRETTLVSSGETVDMWKTVSGPTVERLLDEIIIMHEGGIRPDSLADRMYGWASPRGEWYVAGQWNDQYNSNSQTNPPGLPSKPPAERPKYKQPKHWPDPKARWLWLGTKASQNEGGYLPPRRPQGNHFFRKQVVIPKHGTDVRLFVTGDAHLKVYIDGDLVIARKGLSKGYRTFAKHDTRLTAGAHTIAVHMEKMEATDTGDRNYAFMFTMMSLKNNGDPDDVLVRSNSRWECYHGPRPPGWNRAQILRNIVLEARARGNDYANALTFGFTGSTDSNGRAWMEEKGSQTLKVGTSALNVALQLSERPGFDFWVNPNTMTLEAARRRGVDKAGSVALSLGMNLMDWGLTETDEVKNVFLVQYDGGFFVMRSPWSVRQFGEREAYIELGGIKSKAAARNILQRLMSQVDGTVKASGSPSVVIRREKDRRGSVVGVEGSHPFLDFDCGDIVSATNEDLTMKRCRTVGLVGTEDDDGNLTYDPVLEEIR